MKAELELACQGAKGQAKPQLRRLQRFEEPWSVEFQRRRAFNDLHGPAPLGDKVNELHT